MALQVKETEAGPRDAELERLELELLLEAIHRRYGFDFRDYAPASLKRRIWQRIRAEGLGSVSGLQERVLHEPEAMERLVDSLSITVTSMFRDPDFFGAFREQVVPLLRTYPFARIWNPGCSTGEETWSLAILLAEAGLADRVRIYATDINENVLERAREGVFPLDKMQEYTRNYIRAGGTRAFSEYYVAAYDGAQFQRGLADGIVFAQHNLVSDGSFNEFQAIVCRNVLIYFGRTLQEKVHRLFHDSLAMFGILVLGQKESIRFTGFAERYEVLDAGERIYRKVA